MLSAETFPSMLSKMLSLFSVFSDIFRKLSQSCCCNIMSGDMYVLAPGGGSGYVSISSVFALSFDFSFICLSSVLSLIY